VADIQALVFDTYGTVVDWRAGVIEALVALGRSRGLNVDWDAFLSDCKTRPIMDSVNRGELP
jgi:2-haloacid dehalogenase